jgi:ABC-2 type transport system ATP-binding protein
MWAVETTELTKEYRQGFWRKRGTRALDHFNLIVEPGEVFGLLGPNGAGKTTLLKLLLRLIFPTAGSASLLGRPVDDVRAHARIGYLPENPDFYDHLTAAEYLNYAGWLYGVEAGTRTNRTRGLLEQAGLAESAAVPLRHFSKGMVQRLGIAQALVNDPELLLLDEPMSGLDPLGRRHVRNLMLGLKRRGKTVFLSTHILSDAETLCDRVAILNHGRLQCVGGMRDILGSSVESIELLLHDPGPQVLAALSAFTTAAVRTGDGVRLELPAGTDVDTVLAAALGAGAHVLSVNPIKMSLEDYFLARTQGAGKPLDAARPGEQAMARTDRG